MSVSLKKSTGYLHFPANTCDRSDDQLPESIVFLDRDGVLIEDIGYLAKPGDINILPWVPKALRLLAPHFRLIVVTNQSGIAKGLFNETDLLAVHQELASKLENDQASIEAFYYCPHHPHGDVAGYNEDCECRKPKPGLLQQASHDFGLSLDRSYIVGDNLTDLTAGKAAGAKSIIVGENRHKCPTWALAAENLLGAARLILKEHLDYMNKTPEWRN